MHCHIYLRKGTVFIPTSGNVHKGLYRDIEPVAAVAVSNTDAIRQALHATIARGNPATPHYPRGSYPQPVVLKYAGVKTWLTFARGTSTWTISEEDGNYHIIGKWKHPDGWRDDPDQKIELPSGSTMGDLIDRMIAILQDTARK
jgi:hypothetical protein